MCSLCAINIMVYVDLVVSPALHKFQWRHTEDGAVTININDEIDSTMAAEAVQLVGQARSQGQKILPVIIDSPGGCVYSLLSLIDTFQNCGLEIITVCTGRAFSAASVLLACGHKRFMSPSATCMVHQVSSFSGWLKSSDLAVESAESSKLNKTLLQTLSDFCGKEASYWSKLLKRNSSSDYYMSANVCKEHSLIDHIAIPTFHMELRLDCSITFKEQKSTRDVDSLADFEKENGDEDSKKVRAPRKKNVDSEPEDSDEDEEEDEEEPPPKRKRRKTKK